MYRLSWLETWSAKQAPINEEVSVDYAEDYDGWFEHNYWYNLEAKNDEIAILKAKQFIKDNPEFTIEIFSLSKQNGNVILTEEDW